MTRDPDYEEELYVNGEVELAVFRHQKPLRNLHRIKIGGVCYLEATEQELLDLFELLDSYVPETYGKRKKPKKWWQRHG